MFTINTTVKTVDGISGTIVDFTNDVDGTRIAIVETDNGTDMHTLDSLSPVMVNNENAEQYFAQNTTTGDSTMTQATEAKAQQYEPYHGVHDKDKLETLIGNMILNGWQGAPVVADGDCLMTGSHRWHAVKQIERMYEAGKTDTEVLLYVVDIRDIYPEFDDLMEEFDNPTIGDPMYAMAIDNLPADIRDEYGIDMQ